MPEYLTHVCKVPRGRRDEFKPGPKPHDRVADVKGTAPNKAAHREQVAAKFPHRRGFRLGKSTRIATLLLAGLATLAAGCCVPCGPLPPAAGPCVGGMAVPNCYAVPGCPQYSEILYPYIDRNGRPRLMGDSVLRGHLGLPAQVAPPALE